MKTVKVGKSICTVQTLSEWLKQRMEQIEFAWKETADIAERLNLKGRYAELSIIDEKIQDGRIQEIGTVKFKRRKNG